MNGLENIAGFLFAVCLRVCVDEYPTFVHRLNAELYLLQYISLPWNMG